MTLYSQLPAGFRSKVKFLQNKNLNSYKLNSYKMTMNGVLIWCGRKCVRKSEAPSACSQHTASHVLASLPQVELDKSPIIKKL